MKYGVLIASLAIQVCIGGLYAWSAFAPALHDTFSLEMGQTQLVFGVLILTFTVSMIPAGLLIHRLGPRLLTLMGGLLFGLGYLLAAASKGHFPALLLGIGGLAGIGTGFCYVGPLSLCAAWFPHSKGLATVRRH